MPRDRKPADRRRRRAPWEDSSADEDDSALGTDSSGGGLDSDSGAVASRSSAATLQRAEKERVFPKAARAGTERSGLTYSSGPEAKRQRTALAEGPVFADEPALGRSDQRRETANIEAAAPIASAVDRVDNEEISDAVEIETEPEFDDGYDSQGYGDEQDRRFLLSLTAVERETILAERFERRQREYEAWQFRKALRERRRATLEAKRRRKTLASTEAASTAEQERAKKKTRKQALDALARVKRRGKASSRKRVDDHQRIREDEDASTSDWSPGHSASFDEVDSMPSDAYASDDLKDETYDVTRSMPSSHAGAAAGARHKPAGERTTRKLANPLGFGDLVDPQTGEPTPLVLTRGVVERFHQKPWFARFALGSFVRVPLPVPPAALSGANTLESQQPQQRYVLARVSAILRAPRLYPVPSTQQAHGMHVASSFYVGFRIQAELCGRQRRFTVDQLSRHPPTEIEWMHYEKRHREQHLPLPRREEVDALRAEKAAFMRGEVAPTEEELAQFQTEFERLHPEAVNYARRITQVRAQLAHAQETGDQVQQRTLAAELERLQELEERYGQRPRENTSSEQVRDLLLSRRHNSTGGDVAGVVRASGAPGADLPLAASLMLLKRTVEEQRSIELNPFARRVARGTSYFFTPSKPASSTDLAEPPKHSGLEPSSETFHGDTIQDTDMEEERSQALQTLLPEIERWLWYGPVLEPLRNVQGSPESGDTYTASRAWYERHLVGIQGDHPTSISSTSPDRC
ncbi:hypothetical protein CCYA_CCYA18G4457 [Cyanidiococcus yangmingshanensis]|nr:hypothetical protein CCYA_CCYA18G4457 [Cyanidiococcus yangmingshanensis]